MVVNSDRVSKLGLSNFNKKAFGTIKNRITAEHVGARTETKITHHKSSVENLLLHREKNGVLKCEEGNWYGS